MIVAILSSFEGKVATIHDFLSKIIGEWVLVDEKTAPHYGDHYKVIIEDNPEVEGEEGEDAPHPSETDDTIYVADLRDAIAIANANHRDLIIVSQREGAEAVKEGLVDSVMYYDIKDDTPPWVTIPSGGLRSAPYSAGGLALTPKYRLKETERTLQYTRYSYRIVTEEVQYLDLIDLVAKAPRRPTRNGDVLSLFAPPQMRFDLSDGVIPLLTTKKVSFKNVALELLWFLSGSTDAKILEAQGVSIWRGNSSREYLDSIGLTDYVEGEVGPSYGFSWRHWGADYPLGYDLGIDQIAEAVRQIKEDPYSRRIIITAWNPSTLGDVALPPCHAFFQFYVTTDGRLNCQLYQRSGDVGLGVPYNIASYSLLTIMMAYVTDLRPGEFIHVLGDAHIYVEHIKALKEQRDRWPYRFPRLSIRPGTVKDLFTMKYEDLILDGYNYHSALRMEMKC